MVPVRAVACQLEPPAEAYCTDQSVRSTGEVVLLTSSMKSWRKVAPELPPPPYTSLMMTAADGDGVASAVVAAVVDTPTARAAAPTAPITCLRCTRTAVLQESSQGIRPRDG